MNFKVEKLISDKQGRFIILKLSLDDKAIVLVNIYAPNDVAQQVTFFRKLNKQLEEFEQDTMVIGGEFNCVLASNDKRGGNPIKIQGRLDYLLVSQELIQFAKKCDIVHAPKSDHSAVSCLPV